MLIFPVEVSSLDVIDFLLVTTINTGEKVGGFFEEKQTAHHDGDTFDSTNNLHATEDQTVAHNCENNTFYRKFYDNKTMQQEENPPINWSFKRLKNETDGSLIIFR